MNKSGFFIKTALLCAAFVSFVGIACGEVAERGSFSATGDGAEAVIRQRVGGVIQGVTLNASVTNANIVIRRASVPGALVDGGAGFGICEVTMASSNTLKGVTFASGDWLFVEDAGALSAAQITSVSSYDAVNNEQTYTLSPTITADAGEKVYFAVAADAITITQPSKTVSYKHVFRGFRGLPVSVKSAAGGDSATVVSGTYDIVK